MKFTGHVLDWEEPDSTGHLQAVSPDGVYFNGIYRAKEEFLLFGNWYNQEDGEEGIWAFRLVPEMRTSK